VISDPAFFGILVTCVCWLISSDDPGLTLPAKNCHNWKRIANAVYQSSYKAMEGRKVIVSATFSRCFTPSAYMDWIAGESQIDWPGAGTSLCRPPGRIQARFVC